MTPAKKIIPEDIDLPEPEVQSFIVKIWVEEIASDIGKSIWRGHITKVEGGQRRYVKNLDEITTYFQSTIAALTGTRE